MNIFAVVTWYDPHPDYVRHFQGYLGCVLGVIIVDDSVTCHAQLVNGIEGVVYLRTQKNSGVAHALNVGYRHALRLGADWVLSMDQDSEWDKVELQRFLGAAADLARDPAVSILAPNFIGSGLTPPPLEQLGVEECNSVITAGSLIRLSHFNAIGGYNEKLFIDQVDHEFGYRLRREGQKIIRLGGVQMKHEVGRPKRIRLLGRNITSEGHSAARKYYMVRNTLYIRKNYPEFAANTADMILMMLLGVLFVEDEKVKKIVHMVKGGWHYITGINGKLA